MQTIHSSTGQGIPLFDSETSLEQKHVADALADIYSIIIAIDQVEKAYLKDSIDSTEYTSKVNKLLVQYRTYLSSDNEELQRQFDNLDAFKEKYNITAPQGLARIIRGIPVTIEHAIDPNSDGNGVTGKTSSKVKNTTNNINGKNIAEATGNFITMMDAIKLGYRAKDQLHPLFAELLLSVNKVTQSDFQNRRKLVHWIVKINKMSINEVLTDNEARELLFELELAYKAFYALLE